MLAYSIIHVFNSIFLIRFCMSFIISIVLFIYSSFVFGLSFEECFLSAKQNNLEIKSMNLSYKTNTLEQFSLIFGGSVEHPGFNGVFPNIYLQKQLNKNKALSNMGGTVYVDSPASVTFSWNTSDLKLLFRYMIDVNKKKKELYKKEQEILRELAKSYFECYLNEYVNEALFASYKHAENLYHHYKMKISLGDADNSELSEKYCRMLFAKQQYLQHEAQREDAKKNFHDKFALEANNLLLPERIFFPFKDIDSLRKKVLQDDANIQLKILKQDRAMYSALLVNNVISLDLDLRYNSSLSGKKDSNTSVNLIAKPVNLVNVSIIRTLLKKNAIDIVNTRNKISLSLNNIWRELQLAKDLYKTNQEMYKSRELQLSNQKKRHKLGIVSIDKVLESEYQKSQASKSLYESLAKLWVSYFALMEVSGVLNLDTILPDTTQKDKNNKQFNQSYVEDDVLRTNQLMMCFE